MQIANVAIRLLLPRMLSLLPRERARQPVETLVEAIARRRTGRLDVPVAVTHLLKAKLVRHLGSGHRLRKILLVGEDLACLVLEMRLEEKGVCLQATNRPTFFPKRLQSG